MLQNFIIYIGSGTAVTVSVTLAALPMGIVLGLSFALLHIYGGKWLSRLMTVYSTLMRGVPPIVLLFILYFIIAGSINISPFWAGSIALGWVSSAYQMEIFRGALLSVGGGQMLAARAIGMSRWTAVRYVVLPQALRLAIPPWSNEVSIVLKDSSLVYALGVPEILRRAQQLSATTQQPFLAYGTAALIYFILVFTTNRLLDHLEQRTRLPAQL
ncbi:MAG: polar amino acid ABC transporter permease [Anaerolineae bacterium UTCFX2]|jgi:polar amino acid transport system permease protein|nr:amino acid ABC transporter permease [Anaerolineae bacterium]MCZ7554284.1 amino acid ABC transporter permease [Anaerolineales bacterium]OQY87953.1 MAG: polar amino acid ABC transporter permease [Anaerolineae bacterium UTCFX2]